MLRQIETLTRLDLPLKTWTLVTSSLFSKDQLVNMRQVATAMPEEVQARSMAA